jgi:hypothetical protein
MPIKTTHNLLTDSWTDDVHIVEAAIGRFGVSRGVANDCQVALFEIVRDDQLHVNVTHKYPTRTILASAEQDDLPGAFDGRAVRICGIGSVQSDRVQ